MYLVVARERDGFPQARGILLLGMGGSRIRLRPQWPGELQRRSRTQASSIQQAVRESCGHCARCWAAASVKFEQHAKLTDWSCGHCARCWAAASVKFSQH